jgi:hypothetical protein
VKPSELASVSWRVASYQFEPSVLTMRLSKPIPAVSISRAMSSFFSGVILASESSKRASLPS